MACYDTAPLGSAAVIGVFGKPDRRGPRGPNRHSTSTVNEIGMLLSIFPNSNPPRMASITLPLAYRDWMVVETLAPLRSLDVESACGNLRLSAVSYYDHHPVWIRRRLSMA